MTGSTRTTETGGAWTALTGRSDRAEGFRRPGVPIRALAVLLTLAGCSALLAGCDGAASTAGTGDVVRDTADGHVAVRNPAQPVERNGDPWEVELRWAESLQSDPGNVRSWHPEPEIRASSAGVVVSVPGARALTVRSPESGALERVIDPSGEGPGRLDSLFAMAATDSFIAAGDSDGIELFRFDGEAAGRLDVEGRPTDLYGAGGQGIVAEVFDGAGLAWVRYGDPGAEGRRYPALRPSVASRPGANRLRCWKRSADRTGAVVSSCAYPVLAEMDHEGRVRREISLGVTPDSASEAELDAVREQVALQVEAAGMDPTPDALRGIQEREARRHALVKKYRGARRDPVTGSIALLEQVPDYMGGGEATVHLFDRDGVYRARLEFDEFWYDFDVRDGRLFALRRASGDDGDGRPKVVSYGLRPGR